MHSNLQSLSGRAGRCRDCVVLTAPLGFEPHRAGCQYKASQHRRIRCIDLNFKVVKTLLITASRAPPFIKHSATPAHAWCAPLPLGARPSPHAQHSAAMGLHTPLIVALALLVAAVVAQINPPPGAPSSITVQFIIRDVVGQNPPSWGNKTTHPDFERVNAQDPGIVNYRLGGDRVRASNRTFFRDANRLQLRNRL